MAFSYGQAGDLLDDPPEQAVARLAVGGPGARRRDQLQLGQLRHVDGQGVVPLTGVDEQVPAEARRCG